MKHKDDILTIILSVLIIFSFFYINLYAKYNLEFFNKNYNELMNINIILEIFLSVLTSYFLIKIFSRKRNKFGRGINKKIFIILFLVIIIPTSINIIVSKYFVANSINSWFNPNIQKEITDSFSITSRNVDYFSKELCSYNSISDKGIKDTDYMDEISIKLNLSSYIVADTNSNILHNISYKYNLNSYINNSFINKIKQEKNIYTIIKHNNKNLLLCFNLYNNYVVGISKELPDFIDINTNVSLAGKENFISLIKNKQKLNDIYSNTLLLVLLLSLSIVTISSIFISKFVAKRVNKLIDNINSISSGEYGKTEIIIGDDELSNLVKLFNNMSRKLNKVKKVESNYFTETKNHKLYLEHLLDNINAGVIVYDQKFDLFNINKLIYKIFSIEKFDLSTISLLDWPNKFSIFTDLINIINSQNTPDSKEWESNFLIKENNGIQTKLHIKNVKFYFKSNLYNIMLISDVTNLIQIRENQMWSDIAKRLAHEIKNPLTPIVLSAERIDRKITPKLLDEDKIFVKKLVAQIILQVDEIGVLINKFRDFADISKPKMLKTDIILLVSEVLILYEEFSFIKLLDSDEKHLYAYADHSLIRQVLHNIIKNSIESLVADDKKIEISIYKDDAYIPVEIIDNGDGFKDYILDNAFIPYQTTKGAKGSGLGLAIVKKIIDEHNGIIKIFNDNGACVIISIPIV